MNHYKNLANKADDLIEEYLFEHLNTSHIEINIYDLPKDELEKLSALYLEYIDRDTSDCVHQHESNTIDDDVTCSLIRMLKDSLYSNKIDFADEVIFNTIKAFEVPLTELLNERLLFVKQDYMYDNNIHHAINSIEEEILHDTFRVRKTLWLTIWQKKKELKFQNRR